MASFIETIQKRKFLPTTAPCNDDLPVSQSSTHVIGLRRRISSFSVRIQPSSTASSAWVFRKSESMSSLGEFALRRWWWWEWGWGWILSRKPSFAKDLEMNEEESAMLGCHSRGSLMHIFYKLKSEITKKVRSSQTLPTTQRFRYDSFSHAQNFDDGKGAEE